MSQGDPQEVIENRFELASFHDFSYVFDLKYSVFGVEMQEIASNGGEIPDFALWIPTFKGLLEKYREKTATDFQIYHFLKMRFEEIKQIS